MGRTEEEITDDLQGSWVIDHQPCCTCLEYKPTRHKLQKYPIYTERGSVHNYLGNIKYLIVLNITFWPELTNTVVQICVHIPYTKQQHYFTLLLLGNLLLLLCIPVDEGPNPLTDLYGLCVIHLHAVQFQVKLVDYDKPRTINIAKVTLFTHR